MAKVPAGVAVTGVPLDRLVYVNETKAMPKAATLASPGAPMAITFGLVVVHLASAVTSFFVPSEKLAVAVNWLTSPRLASVVLPPIFTTVINAPGVGCAAGDGVGSDGAVGVEKAGSPDRTDGPVVQPDEPSARMANVARTGRRMTVFLLAERMP
jgi:hypothetical protein